MLGSVHDAEDVVQETYLRAWRSFDGFEGRSSLRTWLYRIATTTSLTALERRGRVALPSGLGSWTEDPSALPARAGAEVRWLQPFPDALLDAESTDPAAIVAERDGLRLALVAALQHLPPRQRAVLILRDVLAWRAAEVADLLGTTTVAVKSILQRARAQIAEVAPARDRLVEPTDPDHRALLARYVAAFENAEIPTLTSLLREDAQLEMRPFLTWFSGRRAVAGFLAGQVLFEPGQMRMMPTRANGQPAVAAYLRGEDGLHHAHAIQVLSLQGAQVASVVAFLDPTLFPVFGLPLLHPGPVLAGLATR
jgi:RNA polymerase sigma-70 factor (ECF subfamily)